MHGSYNLSECDAENEKQKKKQEHWTPKYLVHISFRLEIASQSWAQKCLK